MGVPLTVESYGLVVNEKLVKRVPKTWEELFDEAGRMTADTDGDGHGRYLRIPDRSHELLLHVSLL